MFLNWFNTFTVIFWLINHTWQFYLIRKRFFLPKELLCSSEAKIIYLLLKCPERQLVVFKMISELFSLLELHCQLILACPPLYLYFWSACLCSHYKLYDISIFHFQHYDFSPCPKHLLYPIWHVLFVSYWSALFEIKQSSSAFIYHSAWSLRSICTKSTFTFNLRYVN